MVFLDCKQLFGNFPSKIDQKSLLHGEIAHFVVLTCQVFIKFYPFKDPASPTRNLVPISGIWRKNIYLSCPQSHRLVEFTCTVALDTGFKCKSASFWIVIWKFNIITGKIATISPSNLRGLVNPCHPSWNHFTKDFVLGEKCSKFLIDIDVLHSPEYRLYYSTVNLTTWGRVYSMTAHCSVVLVTKRHWGTALCGNFSTLRLL